MEEILLLRAGSCHFVRHLLQGGHIFKSCLCHGLCGQNQLKLAALRVNQFHFPIGRRQHNDSTLVRDNLHETGLPQQKQRVTYRPAPDSQLPLEFHKYKPRSRKSRAAQNHVTDHLVGNKRFCRNAFGFCPIFHDAHINFMGGGVNVTILFYEIFYEIFHKILTPAKH